ncbi:MAG: FAD:protein FMN transferase [Solirubrobacterales bacterium]
MPGHASHSSRWSGCAVWQALGTSVVLRTADPAGLAAARRSVESELAAIDRTCSRFRPDSELSRLNDRPGRPILLSPLLLQALSLALDAARMTGGDVDPTLGRALELAGYDRDWRLLPAPGSEPPRTDGKSAPPSHSPVLKLRALSGWRAVSLERATRTVRLPPGLRLDLGATAKALAADRAAAGAHTAAGCGVLVSLGGDIATAGPAPDGGWRIHVTEDHRSDATAPGQTISIHSGGLATSSTTVRRWSHEGRTMHHILDPATGTPADTCWRTVSVAAESCAHANIACTASLVRGRSALDWLAELELPARLLDQDGSVTTIGRWPAPRSTQASAAVAG